MNKSNKWNKLTKGKRVAPCVEILGEFSPQSELHTRALFVSIIYRCILKQEETNPDVTYLGIICNPIDNAVKPEKLFPTH